MTQEILKNSSTSSRRYGLAAFLLMVAISGCGNEPSADQLQRWITEHHIPSDSFLTLESVTQKSSETLADGGIRLSFEVTERCTTETCLPITLEAAWQEYNYTPEPFQQASKKLTELREPERSRAALSLPEREQPLQVFRVTLKPNETYKWKGTVTAKRNDSGWEFSDPQGQIDSSILNADAMERQKLPVDAVVIESGVPNNPVTQLIERQKKFIQIVADAEQQVLERLERERSGLQKIVRSNQVFEVTLPDQSGPTPKVRVSFVGQQNDGQKIAVLFEAMDNILHRATWTGSLKLTEPPKATTNELALSVSHPKLDGWAISLSPTEGEGRFPEVGTASEILFGLTAESQVIWANPDGPVTLKEVAKATPLPNYPDYVGHVQEWTSPGRIHEGTIQYAGGVSMPIRVTFTEHSDDGNYVRAVVESSGDEYAVAVFEGTVSTSPDRIYSWPVRLNWRSGRGVKFIGTQHQVPLITDGGSIRFAFSSAGECFGVSRSSGALSDDITFQLKPSAAIQDFQGAASRWQIALQEGSRWSGRIVRGNQPAEKILLTVCAVNEDDRSCALTIQNPENPERFRAFAATLDSAEKAIDGYALVLEARSTVSQPTYFGYSGYTDIYGVHRDASHLFRLTADGATMYGISGAGELIQLTRETITNQRKLDQASVSKAWKDLLVTRTRLKGHLENPEVKQTIDVELTIMSGPDELGNVEIELTVPKQRKIRIPFRGTLLLDGDHINAFALTLQKQQAGVGSSLVFGEQQQGVELAFRLADDGKGLIGMATNDGRAGEFMELHRADATAK